METKQDNARKKERKREYEVREKETREQKKGAENGCVEEKENERKMDYMSAVLFLFTVTKAAQRRKNERKKIAVSRSVKKHDSQMSARKRHQRGKGEREQKRERKRILVHGERVKEKKWNTIYM